MQNSVSDNHLTATVTLSLMRPEHIETKAKMSACYSSVITVSHSDDVIMSLCYMIVC